MALGALTVSDDGNLLAYTTDTTGFRQYTLHIKDLRTGEVLPERGGAGWLRGLGRRQPDAFLHRRGRGAEAAVSSSCGTLLGTAACRGCAGLRRGRRALQRGRRAHARRQVPRARERAATPPAKNSSCARTSPRASWTLIEPREESIEYSADHRDGLWYIRANDRGRNFRLVTAPVATPGREHWRS